MKATLCPSCGGHRERCKCAGIRREAFAEAAAEVREYADHLRREWTGPRGDSFVAIMNALAHARVCILTLATPSERD